MPIKSQFNGEEREFHISRDHVRIFEGVLGRSAYALFKEITAGQWRFDDIALVLSFALHGPTKELKRSDNMALRSVELGMQYGGLWPYPPHPAVVKHLEEAGHGNFAELAVAILTEAIFRDAANVES